MPLEARGSDRSDFSFTIKRVIITSTAQRVLDALACDAFIIKPDQLMALN